MKWTMTVAPALLLILTGLATAETVYLKGGGSLEGRVLELSDKSLTMTIEGVEGSRVELPLARVSDYSLFELRRARIDGDSAAAHERLGDWANGRGLLAFAMDEYGLAVKISGDDATPELRNKLADSSSLCGADKLARGKKLAAEGELAEARSFFRDILKNHPTCLAAAAAREQVSVLTERINNERKMARERVRTAETAQNVEDGIKAARKLIDEGDRLRQVGLFRSGSLGKAEDAFLAAITAYERARAIIARVAKLPAARGREKDLQASNSMIQARLLTVYVDVGHNFIVKGNLIRANRYMGLALAIDPNDPRALALRSSIAMATANDRWGRPGR